MLLPIDWLPQGKIRFLDQTRLPTEEVWVETTDYRDVAEAIRGLRVRGAPLIGIAAGYGVALAAVRSPAKDLASFRREVGEASDQLRGTRPTAVNLAWALDRILRALDTASTVDEAKAIVIKSAREIHEADVEANRRMGEYGAALLGPAAAVLTHCNTGSLATGGYGTAFGVLRRAWELGRLQRVIATETRPLLQGARLTAWELLREGVPFTLIVDSAAGLAMRRAMVDAVITGADRIAANGDVANKIGTYTLATLAREHGLPFYVAAPASTIDLDTAAGAEIELEERRADEVTAVRGVAVAPEGAGAWNPAFDVTPGELVTAIITENGVAHPPYQESLRAACRVEATPLRTARG